MCIYVLCFHFHYGLFAIRRVWTCTHSISRSGEEHFLLFSTLSVSVYLLTPLFCSIYIYLSLSIYLYIYISVILSSFHFFILLSLCVSLSVCPWF